MSVGSNQPRVSYPSRRFCQTRSSNRAGSTRWHRRVHRPIQVALLHVQNPAQHRARRRDRRSPGLYTQSRCPPNKRVPQVRAHESYPAILLVRSHTQDREVRTHQRPNSHNCCPRAAPRARIVRRSAFGRERRRYRTCSERSTRHTPSRARRHSVPSRPRRNSQYRQPYTCRRYRRSVPTSPSPMRRRKRQQTTGSFAKSC